MTEKKVSIDAIPTFNDLVDNRINVLTAWIKAHDPKCPDEQRHLNKGSREQVYWHYGYLMALKDVKNLLRGEGNA